MAETKKENRKKLRDEWQKKISAAEKNYADYYDLIKLMHDNEAIILDETIIPLTQQQIATTLNYSKMKVNSMFSILQKEGFVEQKTRGKYVLTDTAESILKTIEKLDA